MDWHHIDRHFDLSKPQPGTISARDYCDLVVHSFVFVELMNDDGSIEGFYITSDKLSGKGIWRFGLTSTCRNRHFLVRKPFLCKAPEGGEEGTFMWPMREFWDGDACQP